MNYLTPFRDKTIAHKLSQDLHQLSHQLDRSLTLMEVCGSHTMAVHRYGLKSLLPDQIKLVSGPGCPVCVTPSSYLDLALQLAQQPRVTITTFGDMMRVPGRQGTLQQAKAEGATIKVVYSPLDSVTLAQQHPQQTVIFLGVGFETTAPAVAAAICQAKQQNVTNFAVLSAHKTMPPPMALLTSGKLAIDGYLCPAHVSAIIGEHGYQPLVKKNSVPCVITGFEPLDILQGLILLIRQIKRGVAQVENEYHRVVRPDGNPKAQALIAQVFTPCDAIWRGLGLIAGSGLTIKPAYDDFDAYQRFNLSLGESQENPTCCCGDILKGLKDPHDCPLFASRCTPEHPIGACMVSTEGSCAAAYLYHH